MKRELHSNILVVDGLNASWHVDPTVADGLRTGGVTAVNATVAATHDAVWVLDAVASLYAMVARRSDLTIAQSTADIRRAKAEDRLAYVIGFQDTQPAGENLDLYRIFHRLGLRVVQLTYNFENLVGCGCQCREDTGLTEFGARTIATLNALGILIDLSHCGRKTAAEAVEASTHPVAVTHANSTTTFDHPRNKPPALLRRVAESGGVVGAVAFPPLLGVGEAGVEAYVAAIDTLVEELGIDHVGLGPDFMERMPASVAATVLQGLPSGTKEAFAAVKPLDGFAGAAEFPRVTETLLTRGYSTEDVAKVMGENWLRLYETVWQPTSGRYEQGREE